LIKTATLSFSGAEKYNSRFYAATTIGAIRSISYIHQGTILLSQHRLPFANSREYGIDTTVGKSKTFTFVQDDTG